MRATEVKHNEYEKIYIFAKIACTQVKDLCESTTTDDQCKDENKVPKKKNEWMKLSLSEIFLYYVHRANTSKVL